MFCSTQQLKGRIRGFNLCSKWRSCTDSRPAGDLAQQLSSHGRSLQTGCPPSALELGAGEGVKVSGHKSLVGMSAASRSLSLPSNSHQP
ncbi:hypothetical protein TgHK011_004186 [Trichoderma gracile]|nr:hypothetical protein TgHK011_004186 [Trichoderma gracile]